MNMMILKNVLLFLDIDNEKLKIRSCRCVEREKEVLNLKMIKYTNIKDIVEYGLDTISDKEKITMNLKDFLYIRRVLEEYMRYLHNPDHYPDIESIQNFLGDASSGGGFECLSTAIYKKVYKVDLTAEIEKMIDDGLFEHPLYPSYYKKNE